MTKNRTTTIPSNTTSVKHENYTKNILQTDSNPVTMEASKSPATESSDQTKAAKLEPLVYRVEEIAQLLAISPRAAYNLCNTTKDFRVLRIGTSIRVNKQSFDNWFAAV
jgi:hypothetical protein